MTQLIALNENLTKDEIASFEKEHNITITTQYKEFLLHWNGAEAEPNIFKISEDQGQSVLNVLFGIGEMYDNLKDYYKIYKGRIPTHFMPIGDDPGGNVICLGLEQPFYEKIYFWDHEAEPQDPNDMSNMYFLADNISEFIENLYEDEELEE